MRKGLFLSRDDGIISSIVNVDLLAKEFSHLTAAKVYDSFFRYEDQQDILKTVDENELDAIVFAGNSPKYFERVLAGNLIIEALKNYGVNENMIAFANIKEQVALAHSLENGNATEKARLMISVALAKVEMCHNIESITVSPRRSVLVVGTNPEGIIASMELLEKGYRVYLVEKEPAVRKETMDTANLLPSLTGVLSDDRAKIFLETEIENVSGWCGEYKIVLNTKGQQREIMVGGVILSVGDDTDWIAELRPMMQLDIDSEGLLLGKQRKRLSGETDDPGIWFIPFRKGNNRVEFVMGCTSMAILALTTILDKNEIEHPVLVTEVDESVCGGCGTCVKTCAFSASSIDPVRKLSVIDPRRCKGCGNCVVACPTGARDLVTFPEKYILQAIDILSRGVSHDSEPKVLAILCNGCGYPAADEAGELSRQKPGMKYSVNVLPVRVECGGNVDTQYIFKAFSKGFDGVAITVCKDKHCHHIVGNTDMERRLGLFREVLRSRNIDDERMRLIQVLPDEGKLFSEEIKSFCEELKKATTSRES
jgi:heterodisulfide reductase subunit A-like polyferredoxin/coenzyme F420-reducing hydrogenase delta subunit